MASAMAASSALNARDRRAIKAQLQALDCIHLDLAAH